MLSAVLPMVLTIRYGLRSSSLLLLAALAAPLASRAAQDGSARSAHAIQMEELAAGDVEPSEDERQALELERAGRLFSVVGDSSGAAEARAGRGLATGNRFPSIDPEFIVFGYLQSETQVFHLRWQALTHVGSRFVSFNANGFLTGTSAFTGRSSYLESGGAAQAAGTKVILVVNQFDDSPSGVIETVLTDPVRRSRLAQEIVLLLAGDSYSHGVNMDLEFSWGPSVRDGLTAFMAELRAELDALDPSLEASIYTNAIHSASQWDFDATTGITPSIDYMLYSMYDWATGLTAHAISDLDNCLGATRMHAYLNAGLPPEKLVPTISTYSRRWNGAAVYNGVGQSSSSSGFTDALFDVTLNPNFGGPYPGQYVAGDEAGWYAWNDGTNHVRTWEALRGVGVKVRHALALRDPAGTWSGRRLGGIGLWSLMWLAEFSSVDPRTGGPVARTRTYPHVYQELQESLAPPGTRSFLLEGFEGFDFRWRDPNESPDTRGGFDEDSSVALAARPTGTGAPVYGTHAILLHVDVEGPELNRAVLAHEILASPLAPLITDVNATLGNFDGSTELRVSAFVPSAPGGLAGWCVQLLVVDGAGELESSTPVLLVDGWQTLTWDLTNGASVEPFVTLEPGLASGDGVLDGVSNGARTLGFFGFAVTGTGPVSGDVYFDQLISSDVDPGGRAYRINEFRYGGGDLEFVEIHGPAGALPTGFELRIYEPGAGTLLRSMPLAGAIVDAGQGTGFFTVGDAGVPGVDDSSAFQPGIDDLPDAGPSGWQLADGTGHAYDSLVLEAFGGLGELVQPSTRNVTGRGRAWLGETASGLDTQGVAHSTGRFPDGRDRRINALDFGFQRASPGAPNGTSIQLPLTCSFESTADSIDALFQTFDAPRFVDPAASGLLRSPDGGLAWRCVDAAGGGVLGIVGDAGLGVAPGFTGSSSSSAGLRASAWILVPASTGQPQAIGFGLAGSQGSNFFSSTSANSSGYESGYWLVYETRDGVGLADGRADHGEAWEFVFASHDNQDSEPVALLGAATNVALGVVEESWVRVSISIAAADSGAAARLMARIAGSVVFDGPVPAGAPVTGAFQLGFRENHSGPPGQAEGTWIDGLRLERVPGGPRESLRGAGEGPTAPPLPFGF